MRTTKVFLLLLALLSLTGCASVPGVDQRTAKAERLAMAHGWQGITLETALLPFRAFGPEAVGVNGLLTVYIEGDGLAWITRSKPSGNPTPVRPTGLELALADPGPSVAYLARPCQYLADDRCRQGYWLGERFSADVVGAMSQALDSLKTRYRADQLMLVGYSGGGALAVLLAVDRTDVAGLVTVAGNLDHAVWTRHHRTTPLAGSMNPVDQAPSLARLPQWHITGAEDSIVPAVVTRSYVSQLADPAPVTWIVEPEQNHYCCWVPVWPELIAPIRQDLADGSVFSD